jgi:transposase
MGIRRTEEFRNEAVRIALASGLSQKQVADDLGIGLSTLSKWIVRHKQTALMSGPHDDKDKELARLRKENRILREERDILKKRRPSSRAKADEVSFHRTGEGQLFNLPDVQSPESQ